ncbi:MAG TPA: hypothetical protein VI248_10770 [Kineosporiaceae bacterium]
MGVAEDRLAGLPGEVRRLLAAPPVTDKKLLELAVAWTGLPAGQAWMADRLRVFVITWDPLEQLADRPDGFATVNADASGVELAVYLPLWSVLEQAGEQDCTAADVVASWAGSAVVAATALTPRDPAGGRGGIRPAPDLLADRGAGTALGTPEIGLVSPGWEDIGLGAITDVVQAAFGPVDLDRSPVELAAAGRPQPGCPACAGGRFGFPGELAESQTLMCPAHRAESDTVIRMRLARASASSPDGWAALADATIRRELPHLPNGLATKLADAGDGMYVVPDAEALAERARLVVAAAGWFPGRRDDLTIALGAEPELAGQLPDWLLNLVPDLGRAGLGAQAVAVADALARVDPDLQAMLDGDAAVALAQAGLSEQARARIEANLDRWPDDVWIRIHAGDALAALGDLDSAAAHFDTAVTMAEDADDFDARSAAIQRLRRIDRRHPSDPRPTSQPRRQPRRSSRSRRKPKR